MRKLFLSALTVLFSSFVYVNAQSFEGKMTMSIEYEEVPEEMEPYIGMLPKETQMYVKGKKTRIEQNTMAGSNITIMDTETNKGYIVMNMMGQKAAYEMNAEDIKKTEEGPKPVVTYKDETKEIAGYKCKKAELKYDDEEESMVIWYTEEITDVYNQQFSGIGIKGAVMEYSVNANGMAMTMTVKEIKKEKISDDMFTVPAGYEIKPYSDLMKMGMMGGGED